MGLIGPPSSDTGYQMAYSAKNNSQLRSASDIKSTVADA